MINGDISITIIVSNYDRGTQELSTLESLMQMAINDVCGAILPQSYIEGMMRNQGLCVIPIIDPVPQKEVGIVYRKDMFLCKTMDTFMKQVIQEFA